VEDVSIKAELLNDMDEDYVEEDWPLKEEVVNGKRSWFWSCGSCG
jgi:hypothetical protein